MNDDRPLTGLAVVTPMTRVTPLGEFNPVQRWRWPSWLKYVGRVERLDYLTRLVGPRSLGFKLPQTVRSLSSHFKW
jgi:hypothetical protein